jgi:hypothetical protein
MSLFLHSVFVSLSPPSPDSVFVCNKAVWWRRRTLRENGKKEKKKAREV